ncbi:MAG: hypothetical protein M3011_06070 [Actinomycetota bacterium]|nr:hypothetical protein [Actinomycetota bacterium]
MTTAVVAMVLGVLVACSSKGTTTEPRRPLDKTPAPGAVVVSDDAEGYALSLPPSWVKLPTEVSAFPAAADAVRAQAPPAAAAAVAIGLVQLKSAVTAGVSLAAIDPSTGSTANLVTLDANGQKVSEVAIGAANRLNGNGATGLTRETVTVDGIAAVRSRFRNAFSGESGPVNLSESQLYVVRRGQAFILTLTGESADLDGIASSLKLA